MYYKLTKSNICANGEDVIPHNNISYRGLFITKEPSILRWSDIQPNR